MDKFLSCDWGTSSFRLRLVLAGTLHIIAEEKNEQGIAATYRQWEQGGSIVTERERFYTHIIQHHIASLSAKTNLVLDGVPVILSGMASSTIGLMDMSYKLIPFSLDGGDLEVRVLNTGANPLIIISGAQTDNDVMRGEETKVVGCASLLPYSDDEQLLLLPGTHPKHIIIKGDRAIGFKTYMTGEFFDLLAMRSILTASLEAGGDINNSENHNSFIAGVKAGQSANLLQAAFMTRTNQVLKKMPKQQNYFYLSGLLIGAELKDIQTGTTVYLVGGATHTPLYALACKTIGLGVPQQIDADEALMKGQEVIFSKHYSQ
jgi:2-dehydro-3-deoxygalactonokinase